MQKSIITLLITILSINIYASTDIKPLPQKDKMIVLFVKAKNCHWCKKMDQETFKNIETLNKIKKLYEIKKVFAGDLAIPSFIHPKYYPTTYILSADSKKLIDELPGYMKTKDIVSYLEELYNVETHPQEEE